MIVKYTNFETDKVYTVTGVKCATAATDEYKNNSLLLEMKDGRDNEYINFGKEDVLFSVSEE